MSRNQPYEYRPEPDVTGFLGSIEDIAEQQDPWERCTLSALTPARAAERIGRDLWADMADRFGARFTTGAPPHTHVQETTFELRFSRGGVLELAEPVQVALAVDECVVGRTDGGPWECRRTDPAHVATKRHRLFPAMLRLHDNHPELFAERPTGSTVLADLNGAAYQFHHAPREPERPTE